MKVSIDIHGVIDACPKVFADLTRQLKKSGNEVHIVTGVQISDQVETELKVDYGVVYDKIFSITDYHKKLGTSIRFEGDDNPWIDDDIWNRTKADYCERNGIDLHIDDTPEYGVYFDDIPTVFLLMNSQSLHLLGSLSEGS